MQTNTTAMLQMNAAHCRNRAMFFLIFSVFFLPDISLAQAPANDEPCDAAELSNVLTTYTHTTQDATADWYINDCAGLEHKASVWYKFNLENGNNAVELIFNGIGTAPNTVAIGWFTNECDNSPYNLSEFVCDVKDSDKIELTGLSDTRDYYVLVASLPAEPLNFSIVYYEYAVDCDYASECIEAIDISIPLNTDIYIEGCNFGQTAHQNSTPLDGCFDVSTGSIVWYSFWSNASSNFINLEVFSPDLEEIQVAIFSGECQDLVTERCHIGYGNYVELESIDVSYDNNSNNNIYYIAISSPDDNATGQFTLHLESVGPNGSDCKKNGEITVVSTSMGSPMTGPFYPGEIVEVCFEFDWLADQSNNNQWIHGVVPHFGTGWDAPYWDPNWQPTVTSPWNTAPFANQLEWFPEQVVLYNNDFSEDYQFGQPVGAGWFAVGNDGSGNGIFCNGGPQVDPNCSWGVNPMNGNHFNICFELEVTEYLFCESEPDAHDLTIAFTTFGDGETGSWNELGCGFDQKTVENFTLHCCDPISTTPGFQYLPCPSSQLYFDLNDLIENPTEEYSFTWTLNSSNAQIYVDPSLEDCSDNCAAVLNGYVDNNYTGQQVTLSYKVQIFNSDGCNVGNSVLTVIIPPGQENYIIGPSYMCLGECATYQVVGEVIYNGEIINDQFEFCAEAPGTYTIEHYSDICPVFDNSTITVYESLEVEISTDTNNSSFCFGQGALQLFATSNIWAGYHVQYSWKPPGASDFELTLDPIFIATEPGIYQVRVRSAFGNCESIAEIELFDDGPTLSLTTGFPNNEVCINDLPIEIVAQAANGTSGGYTYDWALPDGSIFTGSVYTADNPGFYTVVVTDAIGCSATESIELSITDPMEIDFLIPSQVCVSDSEQNILAATPAGGNFTGEGVVNGKFLGDSPGTYAIDYDVIDDNGCNATGSFEIEVLEMVAGFVDHPQTICRTDELIPLVANPPGGEYSSSPIIEGNNIRPNIPGVYDIVYTFGDPNSDCSGDFTFSITVYEAPIVSLSSNQNEFCQSNIASEALTFSPAGGTFTQGNLDVDNNFIPSQVGENIIEYTYTDPTTGCSALATTTILVTANSTVSIQTPGLLCAGSTGQAFGFPEGGEFDGPGISADGIYSAQASGSFEISYSYENSAGCVSETTAIIEVAELPTVSVAAPLSICAGSTALDLFTANPSGGIYAGDQVNADGLFTPSEIGQNEIEYSYTDPNTGCSNSFNFTITVEANSSPQFITPPSNLCLNSQTIQLEAIPNGGIFSGSNVSSDGIFSSNEVGIHPITYTLGAGSLCPGETTIDIEVFDLPTIALSGPSQLCTNDGPVELVGNPAGGLFIGNSVNAQGIFTPNIPGDNVLSYEYTDAAGCSNELSISILVSEPIAPVISGPTTVCLLTAPFNMVEYTALPTGGAWSANVSPDGMFIPDAVGFSTITYTSIDNLGCEATASFEIEVLDIPAVSFSGPATVCLADVAQVNLSASPSGGTFSGAADSQGNFTGSAAGTYEVSYSYADPNTGCDASETISIEVTPDVNVSVQHPANVCLGNQPLDILTASPAGGTYIGPVNAAGEFEPYQFGINTITYHYTDPQSGCSGSYTFTIEVLNEEILNEPMMQTYVSGDLCVGAVHQFCIFPVPNAQDYIWTANNAIIQYATADHLCVNVGWNMAGADQLCITPIGNCGPSPNVFCVDVNLVNDPACVIFVDVEELAAAKIDIFPNPSSGLLQVQSNQALDNFVIYNAMGQIILQRDDVHADNLTIDLSDRASGIYFIKIGDTSVQKVLIAR